MLVGQSWRPQWKAPWTWGRAEEGCNVITLMHKVPNLDIAYPSAAAADMRLDASTM